MSLSGANRDDAVWGGLRLAQRERLSAAVRHLHDTGSLRRKDIMQLGEVSVPQASIDINEIKRRLPALLEYDGQAKCYRASSKREPTGHTFWGTVNGRKWMLTTDTRPTADELKEIKHQIIVLFDAFN